VHARFMNGRLEPVGPLDLTEEAEVAVTIFEFPGRKNRDVSCRAAGAWKGTIVAEDLIRDIYADRLLGTKPEPNITTLPRRREGSRRRTIYCAVADTS